MLYPGKRTQLPARWRPYQTDNWYWRFSDHYEREARKTLRPIKKWAERETRKLELQAELQRYPEFAHLSEVDRKWAIKAKEQPVPKKLTARAVRLKRRKFWDLGLTGGWFFWSSGD